MKYKIRVTQEHIDNGKLHSFWLCPIAIALKAKAVRWWKIYLFIDSTALCYDYTERVSLPRSARRFIKQFDNRKPVKPFNFMVTVP